MVMGECSADSRLRANSEVEFAAWPTSRQHLALTDFGLDEPQ